MPEISELTIPVAIELGDRVQWLADTEGASLCQRQLAAQLRALLRRLGLQGEPTVEVRVGAFSRAVRIRVRGKLQPFSPALMRSTWRAVAPENLRDLADSKAASGQPGFPDEWFQAHVAGLQTSGEASASRPVFEFLARMALEVIREQPACLIGPAQAAAYAEAAASAGIDAPTVPPAARLLLLLQALVGKGVDVTDQALILDTVREAEARQWHVDDMVEAAFTRLKQPCIEIHANPDYLKQFLPDVVEGKALAVHAENIPQGRQEIFRHLRDGLFYQLGLILPEVVWLPSPKLPPNWFAFKINDRLAIPVQGLKPGELLVNATASELSSHNQTPLRSTTNPATGAEATVVAESAREALESKGYITWDAPAFIVLAMFAEISRLADRLFGTEEVEYQLARLETAFPDLVHAALSRFSVGDLTRVLCGLLREGISIRDLRTILDRLLQFDTIRPNDNQLVILDDRWPLAEAAPPWEERNCAHYREFVRHGMKNYLSQKYSRGKPSLQVLLLDPTLETRAAEVGANVCAGRATIEFSEVEEEAIRASIWAEVNKLPASAPCPTILTTRAARPVIRELVARELPDLPVLADRERLPELAIMPVAHIRAK